MALANFAPWDGQIMAILTFRICLCKMWRQSKYSGCCCLWSQLTQPQKSSSWKLSEDGFVSENDFGFSKIACFSEMVFLHASLFIFIIIVSLCCLIFICWIHLSCILFWLWGLFRVSLPFKNMCDWYHRNSFHVLARSALLSKGSRDRWVENDYMKKGKELK